MAVKTEKEIRRKSQERHRLSLIVNGQPVELEVGTKPHQVDPALELPGFLAEDDPGGARPNSFTEEGGHFLLFGCKMPGR